MNFKYKLNYSFHYINTQGSISKSKNIFRKQLIELNIDFLSHNIWKKNIKDLEKQQQITSFAFKFDSFK